MEDRTLKIHPCLANPRFPLIILQGKWLGNAGFKIGDYVKVGISEGELIIRPMHLEEMEAEIKL
jgi:hypothetical protein